MENIKFLNYNKSKSEIYENFKEAGVIHNNVRICILQKLQNEKSVDIKLLDLVKFIENKIIELKGNIGFPVGLSINNCCCHWTPNYNDTKILNKDDLIKIDYGVHIDGCIVDSAFSFSYNNKFNELINISKKATNIGIKNSGPDAILGEIGKEMQDYIESKEIYIDNKLVKLNTIKSITGHKISPYRIHSDKCVPNFYCSYWERMLEDEYYAIEPYITTGKDNTIDTLEVSHYSINTDLIIKENKELIENGKITKPIKLDKKENYLYKEILKFRDTLPFCKRWLKEQNYQKYQIPLFNLVKKKKIIAYPPLNVSKGDYVCQTEHTIYINENGREILS